MVMLCTTPLLLNGPPPKHQLNLCCYSRLHIRTPFETLPREIFVPRSKICHHSKVDIVYSCRTVASVSCSRGTFLCVRESQQVTHLMSEIVTQCFPTRIPQNIVRVSTTSREKNKPNSEILRKIRNIPRNIAVNIWPAIGNTGIIIISYQVFLSVHM